MKEQLDIEINILNEKALKDLIGDIKKGLEDVGDSSNGDQKTTDAIQAKTEAQQESSDAQKDKIRDDKRETRGLEHLLRRYRWAQSLFLVTQNFMGRMGESISVFGAGMNMLFAPFKMFFNVLLLPALPILAAFSKALMGGVKWFADWFLGAGGLATAISSAAWAMAMFIQTLPIAGLIVGIGEGLKSLIYGFLGIEDVAKPAGEAGESFGKKVGKGLKGAFDWIVKEGPAALKRFWGFLEKKTLWVIDNLPTIKTKLAEIWTYIDQTVIPGVKGLFDKIITADLPGIMESLSTKGTSFIKTLGNFFTKHGPLIDRILLGGGTIAKAVAKVAGPIGVIMALSDLVQPVGGGGQFDKSKYYTSGYMYDYGEPYPGAAMGLSTPVKNAEEYERLYNVYLTVNTSEVNVDELYGEIVSKINRESASRGATI